MPMTDTVTAFPRSKKRPDCLVFVTRMACTLPSIIPANISHDGLVLSHSRMTHFELPAGGASSNFIASLDAAHPPFLPPQECLLMRDFSPSLLSQPHYWMFDAAHLTTIHTTANICPATPRPYAPELNKRLLIFATRRCQGLARQQLCGISMRQTISNVQDATEATIYMYSNI